MLNAKLNVLLTIMAIGLGVTACSSQNLSKAPISSPSVQPQEEVAPLLPIGAFFNESQISQVQLSADSKWLAWLQSYNGISNIFVMPVSGNIEEAYPLTQFDEPVDSFSWDANNLNVFFSRDFGGNENQQIYQIITAVEPRLVAKDTVRLTQQDDSNYIFIGQVDEQPDILSFAANHDDPARIDVYQLNLKTKALTTSLVNELGFQSFLANKEGELMVGVGGLGNGAYALYSKVSGEWKRVLETEIGEQIQLVEYNEQEQLAYLSTSLGELDTLSLLSVNLKNGHKTLIHQDPRSRSDVYATEFDENGVLSMISYYYGYKENYFFDEELEQYWQQIRGRFDTRVEIDILQRNEETGKWLVSVDSDVDVGSIYLFDENNNTLKLLLKKDPTVKTEHLAKRQSITYPARDGVTIQAYLTLPKGKNRNLPAIILPHGGPWARDHWTLSSGYFNRVAQLLANRGYAVLQPNFRASTGFGETFYNLGNQNWGTGYMQHDLTDGAMYLVEQGIADKQRLGIMGGSYGGYAALAGITFTPELYQASISFVGPSSLVTLINSFPDYYRPYLGNWYAAIGDPLIAEDIEKMQARSPINFVERIKTPLLLVQGANDPRVTQKESDQIAKKMQDKGLDVEYMLAKDEGHGFSKRINNQAFLLKMERFFAKHLGGNEYKEAPLDIERHLEKLMVDTSKL